MMLKMKFVFWPILSLIAKKLHQVHWSPNWFSCLHNRNKKFLFPNSLLTFSVYIQLLYGVLFKGAWLAELFSLLLSVVVLNKYFFNKIWWHLVAFIDHYTNLYEIVRHQLSYMTSYITLDNYEFGSLLYGGHATC